MFFDNAAPREVEVRMHFKRLVKDWPGFFLGAIFLPIGILLVAGDNLVGKQITDLGGYWARPLTYIRILGGIMIALSGLLLLKSLKFRRNREYEIKKIEIGWGFDAGMTAFALIVYCIVMPLITFVPATLALVFGMNLLYKRRERTAPSAQTSLQPTSGPNSTAKSRLKFYLNSAIYASITTFALYMLFTRLLNAVLP
jgi:hypothetical protein